MISIFISEQWKCKKEQFVDAAIWALKMLVGTTNQGIQWAFRCGERQVHRLFLRVFRRIKALPTLFFNPVKLTSDM
jgi:hypothetical protein